MPGVNKRKRREGKPKKKKNTFDLKCNLTNNTQKNMTRKNNIKLSTTADDKKSLLNKEHQAVKSL